MLQYQVLTIRTYIYTRPRVDHTREGQENLMPLRVQNDKIIHTADYCRAVYDVGGGSEAITIHIRVVHTESKKPCKSVMLLSRETINSVVVVDRIRGNGYKHNARNLQRRSLLCRTTR